MLSGRYYRVRWLPADRVVCAFLKPQRSFFCVFKFVLFYNHVSFIFTLAPNNTNTVTVRKVKWYHGLTAWLFGQKLQNHKFQSRWKMVWFFLYDCIPFLFISDVASLFHTIEIQSKDLQKKYKRAESVIAEPDNCDRMRQDIQSMKHNWAKEFTCISRFDIACLNGQKTSKIKVVLTMAKGFVGNSTCSIKKKVLYAQIYKVPKTKES